jgi:solute carrier family 35 protein C2
MFTSLFISHLLFESPRELFAHPLFTFKTIPLLLSPGILAFLMTSAEFELIRRTSVVTLSVGGMFKEVLTVLAGTLVFGDQLAVSNLWGVLVTLGGIAWYNWIKVQKMKEESAVVKEGVGYEMVDRSGGQGDLEQDVPLTEEDDGRLRRKSRED